jgi:Flp pilus assembly protein TadD
MSLYYHLSRLFGFAIAAIALPASAQMVQPIPGATAPDPVNTLSVHLRTLAANPRNLFALLGAGQAALDVGDPNAALGFFARADEIDPRSGKAKAGLASALVMLEKPDDALRLFGEAASLGVSESEIARDRGLAYDLRGDARRAQRDYAVALRRGPDDEVTRRYALSLGISGDRNQALTMLDPLLRKQDQAAWRARAFILAMNNDVSGANAIARQVMPASLAGTMSPFLSRLDKLNSAERAHAVNFGTMPSDGQTFASVQIGDPFRPASGGSGGGSAGDGLIPAGVPLGRQTVAVAPVAREKPRPRTVVVADATPAPPAPTITPGSTSGPSIRLGTRLGTRIAAIDPAKLPPEVRGEVNSVARVTAMTALPLPDGVRPPAPVIATPAPAPMTTTSPLPPAPAMEADAGLAAPAAGLVGPPSEPPASPPAVFEVATVATPAPVRPAETPVPTPVSRLASILSGIETEAESAPVVLPTTSEIRATQRTAARKAAAVAEAASAAQLAKEEKAKAAAAAKANPARIWVQVATGSNVRGLTMTWRKIRDANEKLLKPYGGYSVPFRATNRILAGPVRSAADARALVAALGKAGVSASSYTSEIGQEVLKLAAK